MRRLPPLTALRTFEAFGRAGNVRDAADELNVTPAAVGHQIRLLEEHLGVELVCRAARGTVLSQAGREFYLAATAAFDQIQNAARKAEAHKAKNIVRVDSLPSFANCWLVPRLSEFYAENPDTEVEVTTVGNLGYPAALAQSTADIAIRVGVNANAWSGLTAEELVHEEMFPACAPSLLRGNKALREPADLANHTLLIVSRRPEGWPEWLAEAERRGGQTGGIDPEHGLKFDTIQLATTAAAEGIGVVIGRTPLIDHYLETGLLVEPFKLRVTSRSAYWLVYQKSATNAPAIQLFRHWLHDALGLTVPVEPA